MMKLSKFFIILLLSISSFSTVAKITLAPLFSDHMILQRDMPISISGSGEACQKINIKIIGFEIAEIDGKYFNAVANIINNQIDLTSENVRKTVSIRYGWKDISPANLYNIEGFPAVPFRLGEKNVSKQL